MGHCEFADEIGRSYRTLAGQVIAQAVQDLLGTDRHRRATARVFLLGDDLFQSIWWAWCGDGINRVRLEQRIRTLARDGQRGRAVIIRRLARTRVTAHNPAEAEPVEADELVEV